MKIYLSFSRNEARHLRTLEAKQTLILQSDDLEIRAHNQDGEIHFQIKRDFRFCGGNPSPIFVKIPQTSIRAGGALCCRPIQDKF